MSNDIIKYETTLGEVELSPEIIRTYLVNGSGKVTDQEVMMFLNLCKYQKLNPFIREAYIIKYGDQPATIVTGKETFTKRAAKNKKFLGHETGISDDGKKAWAKVHVEGYKVPIQVEVDYSEYVGLTKEGKVNRQWASKPKTMLKKVALVQALREAFPDDFGGLYSPEEINSIDSSALPTQSIKAEAIVVEPSKPQTEQIKDKLKGKKEPEDLTSEKAAFAAKCKELELAPDEIAELKKFIFKKAPTKEELQWVIGSFSDFFDAYIDSCKA